MSGSGITNRPLRDEPGLKTKKGQSSFQRVQQSCHARSSRLLGQRLCDSMHVWVQQRTQSCVCTAVGIIQYWEGVFGEGGGQLDRWRARGGLDPCARESKARTGRFLKGKTDLWPRSFFFLRGPHGAANGQDSWGFFKDTQGFGRLDAGSRAGFASSRPPPPWTSIF